LAESKNALPLQPAWKALSSGKKMNRATVNEKFKTIDWNQKRKENPVSL
jgi:hypothetical protein